MRRERKRGERKRERGPGIWADSRKKQQAGRRLTRFRWSPYCGNHDILGAKNIQAKRAAQRIT
jgi:hypothetical protein